MQALRGAFTSVIQQNRDELQSTSLIYRPSVKVEKHKCDKCPMQQFEQLCVQLHGRLLNLICEFHFTL
jgi:hypothetical protein